MMYLFKKTLAQLRLLSAKISEFNATRRPLRIDDVRINGKGSATIVINFSGKCQFLTMTLAELLQTPDLLGCFSAKDINKIIELALVEARNCDYEIISESFANTESGNYFTIKNLKTDEEFNINIEELYKNKDLLRKFDLQDILKVAKSFYSINFEREQSYMRELRGKKNSHLKVISTKK